jgi:hypothetical protein
MRRYSTYSRQRLPYRWLNPTFIVPTEEAKQQLIEASDFLHWFGVHLPGRKQQRRDIRFAGLDSDIMFVNVLMHTYCHEGKLIVVDPLRFDTDPVAPAFDMRIEVPNAEEAEEILLAAQYLRDWQVWVKGKGTKKPLSKIKITIPDDLEAVHFVKQLVTYPEKIIVTSM